MRSRWFHTPLLHTSGHPTKRVSWLELFFDLVFVASIIQLGDALAIGVKDDGALDAFVRFTLHFVPLWTAWTGFTFYANRFEVDDFLHRIMVLAQMFCIGALGASAPAAMFSADPRPTPFALAFASAQGLVALMYVRAWRHTPEARAYSAHWGGVFAAGAVFWGLSVLVPQPWNYVVWVLGTLSVLVSPLSRASRELKQRFPMDMEHLAERYGLLTIIVLGESFVKVLSNVAEHRALESDVLGVGALTLLITACVWWIYFDDIAGSRLRDARGGWLVWFYGHLPLALGITASGVALKYTLTIDTSAPAAAGHRFLLTGALGLTFLAVAMIDAVTERRQAELSDATRVNVRAFSGLILLLVGQVGGFISGGIFLGLVTAVCVAQVIFDMIMAPFEEDDLAQAQTTADMARERLGAGDQGPVPFRRPELGTAVKRGMPSELRSDLYSFFMEGSWTRVILLLGGGFVALNVLFALLYLLDPGGIAGSEGGFVDAFAFSVQTMATIGYGAMSPATAYTDLIVTLEAAIGMLVVALATGLMFAKASRPVARVLFSDVVVLSTWHGKPTLVLRVGNARNTEIVDATLSWTVLLEELSPEGIHLRRLYNLDLVRNRSPLFILSWTVQHVIDEDSPLYGFDWSSEEAADLAFVVTLIGHDATYGQTTHARRLYQGDDVRIGHTFVDIMSQLPDGRMMIDYEKFHDTEPEA